MTEEGLDNQETLESHIHLHTFYQKLALSFLGGGKLAVNTNSFTWWLGSDTTTQNNHACMGQEMDEPKNTTLASVTKRGEPQVQRPAF